MMYGGRVQDGTIILDGAERPCEGLIVRMEVEAVDTTVGDALEALAGKAEGLPADLADRHDDYRRNGSVLSQ